MEKLSFFEKLGILGSNILAHPLFIVLLLVPVVLLALNKRITKKGVIAIYVAVIAIVLFVGNTTLFQLFDNMVDGLFMTLYFPNFITLFIVVVLSAIITLITFLKRKIRRISKIINVTGFGIIMTIFCLILTVVQVNNIDIYKENALYSNNDVLTLMQLLMGAFALQIVTLIVVHAIETITDRLDTQEEEGRMNSLQKKIHRLNEKIKMTDIEIPQGQTVIKTEEESEEEIKPLDKSLIEEEKIAPIDLNDEKATQKLAERYHVIQKHEDKPNLLEPMGGIVISKKKKRRNKPQFVNPKIIYVTPPQELYDQLEKDNKLEELERIKKASASILERSKAEKEEERIVRPRPKFVNDFIKAGQQEVNKTIVNEPIETITKPIIETPQEKQEPVINEVKAQPIEPMEIKPEPNVSEPSLEIQQIPIPVTEQPKTKFVNDFVKPNENIKPKDIMKIAEEKPEAKIEPIVFKGPFIKAKQQEKQKEEATPKTELIDEPSIFNPQYIPEPVKAEIIPEPQITEEAELITNLVVVKYEKTIKAIKNIKRIYTM